MTTEFKRIKLRRGDAATNPVLAEGEPGWETDTGLIKVGDGETLFRSLRPLNKPIIVPAPSGIAAVDTSNLTDAIGDAGAGEVQLLGTGDPYLVNTMLSPSAAGLTLRGVGTDASLIQAVAAMDAVVKLTQLRCRMFDLTVDADSLATTGVLFQNAGRARLHRVQVTGADDDGFCWDTEGTGNNNLTALLECVAASCGGNGYSVPTKQTDNNAIELFSCEAANNTGHGVLFKGENARIQFGIYRDNGGYGIQISESGDATFSQGSVIWFPWLEGNTSGGVRGGGKSVANVVFIESNQQRLSNAAGSEDVELTVINSSGGRWNILGGGSRGVELRGNDSSAVADIAAIGPDTNIPIRLFGKGTGGVVIGNTGSNAVQEHRSRVRSLNPGSIAAQTSTDIAFSMTGVQVGDTITVTPEGAPEAGLVWGAFVTSADNVLVRITNVTAAPIDPAARNWRCDSWRH